MIKYIFKLIDAFDKWEYTNSFNGLMLWFLVGIEWTKYPNSFVVFCGYVSIFIAGWTAQSLDNKFKKLERANEQTRNSIKSVYGINRN